MRRTYKMATAINFWQNILAAFFFLALPKRSGFLGRVLSLRWNKYWLTASWERVAGVFVASSLKDREQALTWHEEVSFKSYIGLLGLLRVLNHALSFIGEGKFLTN